MDEGYFTKLHNKLGGDRVENNLKSFTFKKEVLKAYDDPQEFTIEKHITSILTDKERIWDLKFSERGEFVSALLIDLVHMPKEHQDKWYEHLIKED